MQNRSRLGSFLYSLQRIAASEIIEKDTPFVPEYPRRSLRNDHAAHFGFLTPFGRNLQALFVLLLSSKKKREH